MIADAVLWQKHPQAMSQRLCGMGVLERQLFTLAAAGIRRVWIAASRPQDRDATASGAPSRKLGHAGRPTAPAEANGMRLPVGLEVHWLPQDGDGPVECRPPYLAYSGDYLVRREALADVLRRPHPRHVSFHDERRRGVLQVLPFRGGRVIQFEQQALPPGSFVRVAAADRGGAAEAWLLESARKGHDGLMARVFDRRISLAVTKRLLDTPVLPNHMTVFSSGVGLAGALGLSSPDYAHALAGATLVWLHSVLDGCDGELARLRHQESRFGGVIDFWGDNLVHVALFLSLGLGVFRATQEGWALAFGAVASIASAASAALAYRLSTSRKATAGEPLFNGILVEPAPSAPSRFVDFLTQRDFIYLLVLAAAFGRLPLFLTAAGVGAPIFLVILIYLMRRAGGRVAAAPVKPSPAQPALAKPATPLAPKGAGTAGLRPARGPIT